MKEINRFFSCENESFFLFGPRGTGKSTWIKKNFSDAYFVDLLNVEKRLKYIANPNRLKEEVLANLKYTVFIIDEIQKVPTLLDVVHELMEREETRDKQFVLTGSSARKLKRAGVDLLGGRAQERRMHPFMAAELGDDFDLEEALTTGLVPVVGKYANREKQLSAYLSLYIREEVYQEGLVRNLDSFARFLEAMAFSHGSVLSVSDIARDCSVKRSTVDGYISILEDLLIGVRLPVFAKRAKRRLVSHEKFYYFDAGVFRKLRPSGRLDNASEIDGAALEGLVFQHLRAWCDYSGYGKSLYYWRTATDDEVDFVVYTPNDFVAIEVKRSDRVTRSDLSALKLFKRDYPEAKCVLLYQGNERRLVDDVLITDAEGFLRNLVPGHLEP